MRDRRVRLACLGAALALVVIAISASSASATGTETAFGADATFQGLIYSNASGQQPPSGWEQPGSNEASDWSTLKGPFGSKTPGTFGLCGFPEHGTTWPTDSKLFLYKTFHLPPGATNLHLEGEIDNDATIWVNGHQLPLSHGGNCIRHNISINVPDGYLTLDGEGDNTTVAVEAVDYGVETFFGLSATYDVAAPPSPTNVTLLSATPTGGGTVVSGLVSGPQGAANLTFYAKSDCAGEGQTAVGAASVSIPASGSSYFTASVGAGSGHLVAIPSAGDASNCIPIGVDNTSWPKAAPLTGSTDGYISTPGESRWYKLTPGTDAQVTLTLSHLAANYDLAFFKDIGQAFSDLSSPQALTQLSAEFAGDAYSPSQFSPSQFSPSQFSPSQFSPSQFSPDAFSPSQFSPSQFSPSQFSPSSSARASSARASSAPARSARRSSARRSSARRSSAPRPSRARRRGA